MGRSSARALSSRYFIVFVVPSFSSHLKAFAVGAVIAAAGLFAYVQFGASDESATTSQAAATASSETVTVYKSTSCQCCAHWVDHMRANGFEVQVENTEELSAVKARLGVPAGLRSCHTAVVGSYVVEGHVPARDVKRMLASESEIAGVAVPGMPVGSPGMERGDRVDPYSVLAFNEGGQTQIVAEYGQK